jgi:hypothetical protein
VIVAVPAATPDTRPDVALTVATDTSLLLHTPPDVGLVKVVLAPPQILVAPDIVPVGVATVNVVVVNALPIV